MTRSTKAALLSGLIFPGVGHMVLKRYFRGSILMLSALTALLVIVTRVTKQALTIVDEINSGEILAEAAAITNLVAKSFKKNDLLMALRNCRSHFGKKATSVNDEGMSVHPELTTATRRVCVDRSNAFGKR